MHYDPNRSWIIAPNPVPPKEPTLSLHFSIKFADDLHDPIAQMSEKLFTPGASPRQPDYTFI